MPTIGNRGRGFLSNPNEHPSPLISSGVQVAPFPHLHPVATAGPTGDLHVASSSTAGTDALPFRLLLERCLCLCPHSPWDPPLASEAVSLQMAVVTKDSPGRTSPQSVRGLMP